MKPLFCRGCNAELRHTFVDLGLSPMANSYVKADQPCMPERFYPLHAYVCEHCFLVQLNSVTSPEEIFSEYAYFSSYSDSWVEHARVYSDCVAERFGLNSGTRVVEIASNDGYLLRHFKAKGVPVLGIEPARNVAEAAIALGIPTLIRFFGKDTAQELASEGLSADLIIGNNVLAHVPELNDFVEGMRILLKQRGVITLEFPHLMRLIENNEFDTIYHEHFSYFSFRAVRRVLAAHDLTVFDAEQLSTHGGSLRLYAGHTGDPGRQVCDRVRRLEQMEEAAACGDLQTYLSFGERVRETKRKLLTFLIGVKEAGRSVVGYGAPAKGNTLLNYCGIRTDFLDYTVDRSPHKQGHLLPGTHIPICHPDKVKETRPDYVLILPWNLADEITAQMSCIRSWGGRFVIPIPEPKIL
jgi:2-polyprenyl-3-methyl-5-hydroxy-6-metoxy-1,4-benzoquinol methylase